MKIHGKICFTGKSTRPLVLRIEIVNGVSKMESFNF